MPRLRAFGENQPVRAQFAILLFVSAAALLVRFTLLRTPLFEAVLFWQVTLPPIFYAIFAAVFCRGFLMAVPDRLRPTLQTPAMILPFLVFRIGSPSPITDILAVAAPVCFVLLLRFLPLQRRRVFYIAIALVLLLIPILAWGIYEGLAWRDYAFALPVFLFISSCTSFFLTAAAIHRSEIQQNLRSVLRPMIVSFCGVGPLPVDEALDRNFSTEVVFTGSAWIVGGLLLFSFQMSLWRLELNPIRAFTEGHFIFSSLVAVGRWVRVMSGVMAFFAVSCGCARVLGVPVSYPIRQPWLATNFADYWKRANMARYALYQKVFWNSFGATLSPFSTAIRILAVFQLSALMNVHHGFSPAHFLRWFVEGLLTVASVLLVRAVNFRRVRHYIANGKMPAPRLAWLQPSFRWLLRAMVLIVHGFLYALEGR